MDSLIINYLTELQPGMMQTFKNLGVLPLFTPLNGGPEYTTLKEALEAKSATITEIDQSGSVPQLKVVTTTKQPVLLLDGEELMGAKQNRVLNTSILLKQKSETIIPVSCTEQGRWAYSSAAFAHSDAVMSHKIRSAKLRTVTSSLHEGRGHESDQTRVWAEINALHQEAGTSSPTRAMHDVYTAKTEELESYLAAFEPVPQQKGSMFFINGQIAGFDILSREAAYRVMHPQLVKSYAIEALLQKTEAAAEPSVNDSKTFLQEAMKCQESRFDAVGQGYDYRFEGPNVIGSALVCEEKVIHMAFFKADEDESDPGLLPYRQRREFRQRRSSQE